MVKITVDFTKHFLWSKFQPTLQNTSRYSQLYKTLPVVKVTADFTKHFPWSRLQPTLQNTFRVQCYSRRYKTFSLVKVTADFTLYKTLAYYKTLALVIESPLTECRYAINSRSQHRHYTAAVSLFFVTSWAAFLFFFRFTVLLALGSSDNRF